MICAFSLFIEIVRQTTEGVLTLQLSMLMCSRIAYSYFRLFGKLRTPQTQFGTRILIKRAMSKGGYTSCRFLVVKKYNESSQTSSA